MLSKTVAKRRYAAANRLQAGRWMGARAGDRIWCTGAAGWSKSLRNVWLAAELIDCETVIHTGRFAADERLELIERLAPSVLCMSPTEYRMCARSAAFGVRPLPSLPLWHHELMSIVRMTRDRRRALRLLEDARQE